MIVANLDCELEWSGAPPLPAAVLSRIAALGTLLRILDPSDTLELLAPVSPARIPAIPGLSGPGGVRHRLVRVWGATRRWPEGGSVEVARACNDRRLAATFGEPEDAVVVASIEELERAVPEGAWVAKATICAAGRDRVRRRGTGLDEATRVRLGRLLERGGALVVEPWRDRVLDLGQPGTVEADGTVTLVPPHRLHMDAGGGFGGVTIGADPEIEGHAPAMARAGRAVGDALAARGYRGPFVVDGFVHRDGGATRLRAVVEINARLTFGWIARAWAAHLGDGTLTLGRGAPPADATALLLPDATDDTSAWFSVSRR